MSEGTNNKDMQVVVFYLKDEGFAVDIQQLREVLKYVNITPLPRTADFIEGVINLRGDIIPVIDLRKRFGIGEGSKDAKTRIIIVEIQNNILGLVVDFVTEVLSFTADEIQAAPQGILETKKDFIRGIGNKDGRLIIILDIEKIVSSEEKLELEDIVSSEMLEELA